MASVIIEVADKFETFAFLEKEICNSILSGYFLRV